MLKSLQIANFRNLKTFRLERLGRITLIGGKNGVGKTALLEALWLFSGADLPELSTRLNTFRGLPTIGPDHLFHNIFNSADPQRPIKISAYGDWGKLPRTLEIRLQDHKQTTPIRTNSPERSSVERTTRPLDEGEYEIVFDYRHNDNRKYVSRAWWIAEQLSSPGVSPPVTVTSEGIRQERQTIPKRPSSVFMAAVHRDNLQTLASRLGRLQLSGEDEKILEFIRPLEPRLKGLVPIAIKDTTIIHAYLEGTNKPMPVQLLGEGLNRMLALVLSMPEATGGLLLIDEIENGLHHSVHEKVFAVLANLTRSFDVQVFATTHSDECIRAAYQAMAKESAEDFAYCRLQRVDGEIEPANLDSEMLEIAIEHDMGIR